SGSTRGIARAAFGRPGANPGIALEAVRASRANGGVASAPNALGVGNHRIGLARESDRPPSGRVAPDARRPGGGLAGARGGPLGRANRPGRPRAGMRRCRTVTVEVHYADEGVAIGSCGCVVLFAWRGDVTLERVVAGEAD